jgi:hypothetical protein
MRAWVCSNVARIFVSPWLHGFHFDAVHLLPFLIVFLTVTWPRPKWYVRNKSCQLQMQNSSRPIAALTYGIWSLIQLFSRPWRHIWLGGVNNVRKSDSSLTWKLFWPLLFRFLYVIRQWRAAEYRWVVDESLARNLLNEIRRPSVEWSTYE